MKNFKELLGDVKAFVFDVDGVFTNCTITPTESGDVMRSYNVKDGFAMVHAISKGYPIAIITGGGGEMLTNRFKSLGVTDIYTYRKDKNDALADFVTKHGLDYKSVFYMGDDIPDVAPMGMVGLSGAPADAIPEVKAVATYISMYKGGSGCVRDILEQVLKVHNNWF